MVSFVEFVDKFLYVLDKWFMMMLLLLMFFESTRSRSVRTFLFSSTFGDIFCEFLCFISI